jgi:anti-sigma B factor antagonist
MEHIPTPKLTISVEPQVTPDVKLIRLSGPLTIHNFFKFQEVSRERPAPKLLIVDLTEVPYIDSAALGSFVGLHVSCEGNNRKYALVGANDRLKTLFELTHVKSFLVIRESISEAESLL